MFNITTRVTRQLSFLLDKPLPPATDRERDLVDQLRSRFAEIAASKNDVSAEEAWLNFLARLSDLVHNGDPRQFLRWDVIEETMFVAFASYLRKELSFLRSLPDWGIRWKSAITESTTGRPYTYPYLRITSGNLIHHAYHLAQFEQRANTKSNEIDLVLELGGGYGSLCRLFHNLRFNGRYVIFDLPHFSALQEYYLRSIGVPICEKESIRDGAVGTILISKIDDLRCLLDCAPGNNSLFIGTWSLSETPISFRNSMQPMISDFDNFLIAYQREFEGFDNSAYFRDWKEISDRDVSWDEWTIPHLPESRYLVGKRSRAAARFVSQDSDLSNRTLR